MTLPGHSVADLFLERLDFDGHAVHFITEPCQSIMIVRCVVQGFCILLVNLPGLAPEPGEFALQCINGLGWIWLLLPV